MDHYLANYVQSLRPPAHIDPTTVAYIQDLLLPLMESMDQASDLKEWITKTLPGDLGHQAQIQGNKQKIARYLLHEIVILANFHAHEHKSSWILPWDICGAMLADSELKTLLTDEHQTLPVQVVIIDQTYTHYLSEDFVSGMCDFYRATSNIPQLTIYGQPLAPDYNLRPQEHRHTHDPSLYDREYSIIVGHEWRSFNHLDYLRGLKTAAQWLNLNLYHSVRNLLQYSATGTSMMSF